MRPKLIVMREWLSWAESPSDAPFSLLGGDGGKISGFGAYCDSDSGTDRN